MFFCCGIFDIQVDNKIILPTKHLKKQITMLVWSCWPMCQCTFLNVLHANIGLLFGVRGTNIQVLWKFITCGGNISIISNFYMNCFSYQIEMRPKASKQANVYVKHVHELSCPIVDSLMVSLAITMHITLFSHMVEFCFYI